MHYPVYKKWGGDYWKIISADSYIEVVCMPPIGCGITMVNGEGLMVKSAIEHGRDLSEEEFNEKYNQAKGIIASDFVQPLKKAS